MQPLNPPEPFTAWWWTALVLDSNRFAALASFLGSKVTFDGQRRETQKRNKKWN